MDPFVAEIRFFGFPFAPRGWAACNGQVLPVNQNTTLYSLVGGYYGGNGTTTFALPNLQGSAACSTGQGPGRTNRYLGTAFGTATVTLQTTQLPSHNHTFTTMPATPTQQIESPVANCHLSNTIKQRDFISNGSPDTTFAGNMIGAAGGGQSHPNQQPYLALNACIALLGVYPTRP